MKAKVRSVEQMVDEQLAKWNGPVTKPKKKASAKAGPVITIAREPGTGGTRIGQIVAGRLGMDLISGQIIQKVAQSVEMSERVVCTLDEKEVTKRDDWLTSLFESRHLWPDAYLHHLTKVISTIGRHGNAVILGRGANYILPPRETFRVRFIAPLDVRIANIMALRGIPHGEAKKYVMTTDSDRTAFIRKYFHTDWADPYSYDLVLNMRMMTEEGAAEATQAAFLAWKTLYGPSS